MKLNVVTYSATLSVCEKSQQLIAAVSLFWEMQEWHMKPNVFTFSATIRA